MNFGSTLAQNQRIALASAAAGSAQTPDALLSFFLERLSLQPLDALVRSALIDYVSAGEIWTGSAPQVTAKSAGLVHLLAGSSEYQFI